MLVAMRCDQPLLTAADGIGRLCEVSGRLVSAPPAVERPNVNLHPRRLRGRRYQARCLV